MNKKNVSILTKIFEDYVYEEEGLEFWFARDLQILLGYSKWENFAKVIEKAKESCKNAGFKVLDHFPDVRKTIDMPSEEGDMNLLSEAIKLKYSFLSKDKCFVVR